MRTFACVCVCCDWERITLLQEHMHLLNAFILLSLCFLLFILLGLLGCAGDCAPRVRGGGQPLPRAPPEPRARAPTQGQTGNRSHRLSCREPALVHPCLPSSMLLYLFRLGVLPTLPVWSVRLICPSFLLFCRPLHRPLIHFSTSADSFKFLNKCSRADACM